ncbi:hypothetical protein Cgig2_006237 [Carnegiea gigantea]|uniref:Uncharacterized protein n=1 Tax=Carnegiea gigantea TaxID=171969 RepID=A0A9Q1GPA1_9CARY|nr:hypothetical protein Cgig2_006237 [Carnegiea gigantea]
MTQGQVGEVEDFRRNFVMFMLCYLDRVVFKLRSVPHQLPILRGWTNGEIKDWVRCFLEDTLDKTSAIDEKEQVNEEEHHSKGVEDEGKAALFRDGRVVTDLIITNIRRLVEVIIELQDLIPGARPPLKRVRKVVAESMSDALIRDKPKRLKVEPWYSHMTI